MDALDRIVSLVFYGVPVVVGLVRYWFWLPIPVSLEIFYGLCSLNGLIPLVGNRGGLGLRLVLDSLTTGQDIHGRRSVPALNLRKFST